MCNNVPCPLRVLVNIYPWDRSGRDFPPIAAHPIRTMRCDGCRAWVGGKIAHIGVFVSFGKWSRQISETVLRYDRVGMRGKKSLVRLYMLVFIAGALANQRLHFTKSVPFWRTEALLLSTSGEFFILRTNTEIGLWKNLLVVGNGVWNDPLINMSNWHKFDTYFTGYFYEWTFFWI